jgi:three-Cys-motif partner protein
MALDPDKYEPDEEDGLPREIVGAWVREKHARLERYVSISAPTRRKYLGSGQGKGGATFIDLFSGPGRARIDGTDEAVDGSPLVAWRKSVERTAAFSQVYVGDLEPVLVDAAKIRLGMAGAPAFGEAKPAIEAVDRVIENLNPYGLHFCVS